MQDRKTRATKSSPISLAFALALALALTPLSLAAQKVPAPQEAAQPESASRFDALLVELGSKDASRRRAARGRFADFDAKTLAAARRVVHADEKADRSTVLRRLIGLARVRRQFRARLGRTIASKAWKALWWPGERIALLADFDAPLRFYDHDLREIEGARVEGRFAYLAISPDHKLSGLSSKGMLRIRAHGAPGAKPTERVHGEAGKRLRPVFSPDGKSIAFSEYARALRVVDAKSFELQRSYPVEGTIGALNPVFTPDGKLLVIGNRNGQTEIFDRASGERVHVIEKKQSQQILVTPDSTLVLVAYVDASIQVFDLRLGRVVRRWRSAAKEIFGLTLSPDGELLVSCGVETPLEVWSVRYGGRVAALPTPSERVFRVHFDPTGRRLLEAGRSRTALWEIDFDRRR